MTDTRSTYDVVVVGGGPVGSVAALAHAQKGAKVLVLEAAPRASGRLAGEWLHPPAIDFLNQLGIDLSGTTGEYATGNGFVVYPEDGTTPIALNYEPQTRGFSCEHSTLVENLRAHATAHSDVDYIPYARATGIEDRLLTFQQKGKSHPRTVRAGRIVGADGRSSMVRNALGYASGHVTFSRMAGVLLEDVEMPAEGYGHVFLGGPGPVLAYRISERDVRVILDVPLKDYRHSDRPAYLWDAFHQVFPHYLRPAFRKALMDRKVAWAANHVRPRTQFGHRHMVLVGDAVGHYHPLTALGMTLGFGDAVALPGYDSIRRFRKDRMGQTRVPELLAVALYEVLSEGSPDTLAIRRAVYKMWRENPIETQRTMAYLACQETRTHRFGRSFLKAVGYSCADLSRQVFEPGHSQHALKTLQHLGARVAWLAGGFMGVKASTGRVTPLRAVKGLPSQDSGKNGSVTADRVSDDADLRNDTTPALALERGVANLVKHQGSLGDWEGEVVWCPMLAAQYVLMCEITGTPIAKGRRRMLFTHFRDTRLESGLWGLHEHSEPYLFVTTLVYVAARLLGADKDDPLLRPAQRFFVEQGGVSAIPTWGKFWLALMNLYAWEGVNPVLPELWTMPKWLPIHPSKYYCHTRLIYMAMAAIFGHRVQAQLTPTLAALRNELFPQGFSAIDFPAHRTTLRSEDLYSPPGRILKGLFRLSALADSLHRPEKRKAALAELRSQIHWELKSSDYTSISPVSGLLNIVALWSMNPEDPEMKRALKRFDGWIWEDAKHGTRVTGARSASWDTAFVVQALQEASPHIEVNPPHQLGIDFLLSQQIRTTFPGYEQAFRVNPKGGWCFAGVWHGWPVSDCTAEAVTALLGSSPDSFQGEALEDAMEFILGSQNADGGFGSYDPRKHRFSLEWLNPAEMFGESMTEASFVECTASCMAALGAYKRSKPQRRAQQVDEAMARGLKWLRGAQRPDGAWPGAWGIHFTYGIMFGVRGLRAAGVPPTDPAIRLACEWLLAHQREDGGWGEHYQTALTDVYREHTQSQVIQTAWALSALCEGDDYHWDKIQKAAQWLASMQDAEGQWPRQDMAGVFFRTALLEYKLYRHYFPAWALGLYESCRKTRLRHAPGLQGLTGESPHAERRYKEFR